MRHLPRPIRRGVKSQFAGDTVFFFIVVYLYAPAGAGAVGYT
jgi:hypothetical protein